MESFCKTEDCPASEKLVAFGDSAVDSRELRGHLSVCEFCSAELELYRQYPPSHENVEPSKIPGPLFELADALLHKRRDLTELNKLARRGG